MVRQDHKGKTCRRRHNHRVQSACRWPPGQQAKLWDELSALSFENVKRRRINRAEEWVALLGPWNLTGGNLTSGMWLWIGPGNKLKNKQKKERWDKKVHAQLSLVGKWASSALSHAEQDWQDFGVAPHLSSFTSWWLLKRKMELSGKHLSAKLPHVALWHYVLNALSKLIIIGNNEHSFARQVYLPLWSSNAGSYVICESVLLLTESEKTSGKCGTWNQTSYWWHALNLQCAV